MSSAVVFAMILADLEVIFWAVASAKLFGYLNSEGALSANTAGVAAMTVLAMYLAELYKLDFRVHRMEFAKRLVLVLVAAATNTAAIGYAFPHLRFGWVGFIHTFGMVALGFLAWRTLWIALGPSAQRFIYSRLTSRLTLTGAAALGIALVVAHNLGLIR